MSATSYKENNAGFAAVEAVLLVVIVAIIGGVGAYVAQQKHTADITLNSSSSKTVPAKTPVAAGTTTSIDQLMQQDALAETNIDMAADSQAQQNATSSNSAVTNVGGSYDETSL